MSILTPTPVAAGSPPNPGASDPTTAPMPDQSASRTTVEAPGITPQTEASTTSAPAGTVADQSKTETEDPDAAFNALMDRQHGTRTGATQPAASDAATTPAAPTAQETPKPGDPLPADHQEKDLDPTEGELKDGRVSVKKLTRALAVRRDAIKAKTDAETALQSERNALDNLIDRYAKAGITETEILPILSELENLAKGLAPGAILQRFVKPPAPSEAGIPLAEVDALVQQLQNAIDTTPVIEAFRAKHASKVVTPPAAPVQAPIAEAPRPAPVLDQNKVLNYAVNLMDTVSTIEGQEFADKIFKEAEPAFNAEIRRLRNLGVEITTEVAQKTFKTVQTGVLVRNRQARTPIPTAPPKPSVTTQPAIDPDDPDADFKRVLQKRYGATS